MEKKVKVFVVFGSKKNWQVSAARNKQDCFWLLTLASFFLKKISRNTSLFLLKNRKKVKVFVVFGSKKNWQVSAARNKQNCFFLLTLASFFLQKISRNTSLVLLKNGKKVKVFVIFGSKKHWQVSAARNIQDCFLLLTLASFFLKKISRNTSLFY